MQKILSFNLAEIDIIACPLRTEILFCWFERKSNLHLLYIFLRQKNKGHFFQSLFTMTITIKPARLVWERYPFLELSSIQMSEPNNRPTVRNLIKAKSQTSLLINQRCRLSFIAKCVSLSHAVCGCWSTLSSVSINTHTHTHSISLCLSATLLSFPIFLFHLKALSAFVRESIEIQISPYSVVLIS